MSITSPNTSAGFAGKDFGNGFYLSDKQAQAEEFADWKCDKYSPNGAPFINAYICEDHILEQGKRKHLRIKKFKDYSTEWVDFVYEHRRCKDLVASEYDIIYGPIADGDMEGLFPKYEAHLITKEELLEGLKNSKGITFQYFFGTVKAIQQLQFYCSYKLLSANAIGGYFTQDTTLLNDINWNLNATTRIIVDSYTTIAETTSRLDAITGTPTFTITSSSCITKTVHKNKSLLKANTLKKFFQRK